MSRFGSHFVVYGPTGSGKSTLAQQISQRTGVPHIELDALFWLPDWGKKPLDQFRNDISVQLSKCVDGWVCDGNYSVVRELILPFADTVIWLRPPFWVAFWRLLKRTIARSWDHKLLWGTNRESLGKAFFSRDSIILYQVTHWHKYSKIGQNLDKIPHRAAVIQLRSQKEIDAFLRELS